MSLDQVKQDLSYLELQGKLDPRLQLVLTGCSRKVLETIDELRWFDVDLIVAMPLKNKCDLDLVFKNLAEIDLANFKTGLIFGLDSICDIKWLGELYKKIYELNQKFVFIKPFFTSAPPPDVTLRVFVNEHSYILGKKLADLGMLGLNRPLLNFAVVREEIRLVIKALNCKCIFWLDSDNVPPKDVILRLYKHMQIADLACGWYFDRHYPFEKPSHEVLTQPAPETDEERQYYEHANEFMNKYYQTCMASYAAADGSGLQYELVEKALPVAPSYLKRVKESIDIAYTGFGCVLVKKEVNDRSSFFNVREVGATEDYNFCREARKASFRLTVDPTVFCEHVCAVMAHTPWRIEK